MVLASTRLLTAEFTALAVLWKALYLCVRFALRELFSVTDSVFLAKRAVQFVVTPISHYVWSVRQAIISTKLEDVLNVRPQIA